MKNQDNTLNLDLELVQLKKTGLTFQQVAEVKGMTMNQVKSRIYKIFKHRDDKAPSRMPQSLTQQEKEMAARLYYFGYQCHEIASEFGCVTEEIRQYVENMPRHPDYSKKSA